MQYRALVKSVFLKVVFDGLNLFYQIKSKKQTKPFYLKFMVMELCPSFKQIFYQAVNRYDDAVTNYVKDNANIHISV